MHKLYLSIFTLLAVAMYSTECAANESYLADIFNHQMISPLHQNLSSPLTEDADINPCLDYSKSVKKKKLIKLLKNVVVDSKKITLPGFPNAFNPSIIPDGNEYILTFRITPDKKSPWVSYVGIARLDKSLNLISQPQIVNPRMGLAKESPSQAEDARIFSLKGELYLIYNDNETVTCPTTADRRDMYIAKLMKNGTFFELDTPLKLMHADKYETILWQKNWSPFVWNDQLMISYTLKPHEVLIVDLDTGICTPCYDSPNPADWTFGELRGGTPGILVDGEYLAFYHSSVIAASKESKYQKMHHYYMGAMTFSAEPPFEVTKMTPFPIMGKNFYTISDFHKRVVFPGGFVVDGDKIHVVFGKDDSQVWVATMDRSTLNQVLLPVSN